MAGTTALETPAPATLTPAQVEADSCAAEEIVFPLAAFPPLIQQLALASSEVFQTGIELPAVAALTVLAAANGKQVDSIGAVNGRITPSNLYTAISAPSGFGKAIVNLIARPITDAHAELVEHHIQVARPMHRADVAEAQELRKKVLAQLRGGTLTAAGREEAKQELAGYERTIERGLALAENLPALYTGSFTGAGLAIALKRNGETLFSLAPEAGDVIRIAAGLYRKDGKGDYDLLLSGYTGEPLAEVRASREGGHLQAPCLTALWTCQPTLLNELYSTEEALERGVLARINTLRCCRDVMPYDDGVVRAVPAEMTLDWSRLIRRALDLRTDQRSIRLKVTPEAREVFRVWHNEAVDLRNNQYREEENRLARTRENAIRLANNIAVTEILLADAIPDHPTLTKEHAQASVALARYFLQTALNLTIIQRSATRQSRLLRIEDVLRARGGRERLRVLEHTHNIAPSEARQFALRYPENLIVEKERTGTRGPETEFLRLLVP